MKSKSLIVSTSFVVSLLGGLAPAWSLTCSDAFRALKLSSESVEREERNLRAAFVVAQTLKSAVQLISVTPDNRVVQFYTRTGPRQGLNLRGRIKGIVKLTIGSAIQFAQVGPDDVESSEISTIWVSTVQADTIRVRRVLMPEEEKAVAAKVQKALETGQHVRFKHVDVIDGSEFRGKVGSLERDSNGQVAAFLLLGDSGWTIRTSFASVDPDSLKLVPKVFKVLNPRQADLLSKMKSAFTNGRYVTLVTKSDLDSLERREGWITSLQIDSEGNTFFGFNAEECNLTCSYSYFKLSEIVPDSFEENPTPRPRTSVAVVDNGRNVTRLAAVVEDRKNGKTLPVSVSKELAAELGVFADNTAASGEHLPAELVSLVPPGVELRMYFSSANRSIRLTVRRTQADKWVFGSTWFDGLSVDESFVNSHTLDRYTTKEALRLAGKLHRAGMPAFELRDHMIGINFRLMQGAVEQEYQAIQAEWEKVIPEDASSDEVLPLLLYSQGVKYDFIHGFIRDPAPSLTARQLKTLAAINYLIENKLVHYSVNVKASRVEPGIYRQGEVEITGRNAQGYSFKHDLFAAMERAGLKYVNGQWIKK